MIHSYFHLRLTEIFQHFIINAFNIFMFNHIPHIEFNVRKLSILR